MVLPLTETYISNKFFQFCGKPFYNRTQKTYQGSCPICREGTSWLKKRRCFYIVNKNIICCHNCGWYSNPYQWIQRVSGLSFSEIKKELDNDTSDFIFQTGSKEIEFDIKEKTLDVLPYDSINLFNVDQKEYYKNNKTVERCLEVIYKRRLDIAINKPLALYTSLKDRVHQNRLTIPFYSSNNKIIFYQSRDVFNNNDLPKYLSKVGSIKSLYGINRIDAFLNSIFITEGPIDAMFIQNGVAVAGINESKNCNFTQVQQEQINSFPFHNKIWVLDNQYNDSASKIKTKKLLEAGEKVFIWPKALSKYKDINEYCIDTGKNSFETEILLDNTYEGLKGLLIVSSY